MLKKIALIAALASSSSLAYASSCDDKNKTEHVHAETQSTIVDLAVSTEKLSILAEAVVASGLADTLAKTQDITVFAPTNEAFAALLKELNVSKKDLLANKELLTKVLTYHVVKGKVYSSDVKVGHVPTLQGENFEVTPQKTLSDANGRKANLLTVDIKAKNGVVHIIDKVILPKH